MIDIKLIYMVIHLMCIRSVSVCVIEMMLPIACLNHVYCIECKLSDVYVCSIACVREILLMYKRPVKLEVPNYS